MGTEIERKFIIKDDDWKETSSLNFEIRQGYLSTTPERTVRIRCDETRGWITIKGPPQGFVRLEYEYLIPKTDAIEILDQLCLQKQINKTRHHVLHDGNLWEVDVFHGSNAGLIVAEIELDTADTVFTKPSWVGKEVTDDHRFSNSNLCKNPISQWTDQ